MVKTNNTYERIRISALSLFVKNGFEGAGTKEIADKADVNKALIYYYFNSKKELFGKSFELALENLFGDLFTLLEDDTPLLVKIEIFIDRLLNCIKENPSLAAFIMEGHEQTDEIKESVYLQFFSVDLGVLERQLDEAASNYEVARIDARELLLNITSLCLFPFTGTQFLKKVLCIDSDEEWKELMDTRKGVITDTILNWLTA